LSSHLAAYLIWSPAGVISCAPGVSASQLRSRVTRPGTTGGQLRPGAAAGHFPRGLRGVCRHVGCL